MDICTLTIWKHGKLWLNTTKNYYFFFLSTPTRVDEREGVAVFHSKSRHALTPNYSGDRKTQV